MSKQQTSTDTNSINKYYYYASFDENALKNVIKSLKILTSNTTLSVTNVHL